jgi:hypothetical protein
MPTLTLTLAKGKSRCEAIKALMLVMRNKKLGLEEIEIVCEIYLNIGPIFSGGQHGHLSNL